VGTGKRYRQFELDQHGIVFISFRVGRLTVVVVVMFIVLMLRVYFPLIYIVARDHVAMRLMTVMVVDEDGLAGNGA